MAIAATPLRASASAMATSTTVSIAAEVFRRGLAGAEGAFAVEGMLHLGGHGLVEKALDDERTLHHEIFSTALNVVLQITVRRQLRIIEVRKRDGRHEALSVLDRVPD